MTDRHSFARYVHTHLAPLPEWRWRRAEQLAADDPDADRYTDDEPTLRAARVLRGAEETEGDEVRAAWAVHRYHPQRRRLLEAYLLTPLGEAEVGERTGLEAAAVGTYAALFFHMRGDDPLARLHFATADRTADRLRRAVRYGPYGVAAAALWEAGGEGLSPALAEPFERSELMERVWQGGDAAAYLRAVERLRAVEAGLRPGTLHRRRGG